MSDEIDWSLLEDGEPDPDPEMDAVWLKFLKSLKEDNE